MTSLDDDHAGGPTAARPAIRPSRLSIYVGGVTVAGALSLLAPATWSVAPEAWVPALVTLTVISSALAFLTVPLPGGGQFSMASVPHVATLLLIPAPFAAISIGGSVLLEELVRRVSARKLLFNVGGIVLTASVASFALGPFGSLWQAHAAAVASLALLLPLVVVAVTYFGLNAILLSGVFSIVERRPFVAVLRRSTRETILNEVATTAIGAQFALIWIVEPVLVTVLAFPGLVISRSFDHIRRLHVETRSAVRSMAEIVDHRDTTTFHHSTRVARDAARLARALGLSADEVELIEQSAAVHDLGKIGIPDRVLLKPGPLTADEAATMREHTELGSVIVSRFEQFRPGARIVRHHHEAWDGTGYPDGLAGEAIPLGARVVAVVDAFDAMTSDRPYRAALSEAEAIGRLEAGAGVQWDPRIVRAFVELLRRGEVPVPAHGAIRGVARPAVTAALAADR